MASDKIQTIDEITAVNDLIEFIRESCDLDDIAFLLSKYVKDGPIQIGGGGLNEYSEVYQDGTRLAVDPRPVDPKED